MKQLETLMTRVSCPNELFGLDMSEAKTFVGSHLHTSPHSSGGKSLWQLRHLQGAEMPKK
jgi:hypothetical protein